MREVGRKKTLGVGVVQRLNFGKERLRLGLRAGVLTGFYYKNEVLGGSFYSKRILDLNSRRLSPRKEIRECYHSSLSSFSKYLPKTLL